MPGDPGQGTGDQFTVAVSTACINNIGIIAIRAGRFCFFFFNRDKMIFI